MVSWLSAVAMETVCGMWFYTCARKCSPSIPEQPQTMRKQREECMPLVSLSFLSCSLLLTTNVLFCLITSVLDH